MFLYLGDLVSGHLPRPPDSRQHAPRQPRRGRHPRPHHLRPRLHPPGALLSVVNFIRFC